MKILFLDFDGVMNSAKWFKSNKDEIVGSTSLFRRGVAEFDPVAVQRVINIVDATGAAVVLSTSWRHLHTVEEIGDMLAQRGFPQFRNHIIDITPDMNKIDANRDIGCWRGQEIAHWIDSFEQKNGSLTAFCILDDDGDMLSTQLPNFVQTDWEDGIQEAHVEKAIEILGIQNAPI